MIRLYPASWRARYGDEMEALISDTGADARIVGDLARGGMRMQLKAWPFPLMALVLGLAGLLAGTGIAWLIPNTYASQATLQMKNVPSRAVGTEEIQRLQAAVMRRASLARIIRGVGLYQDEQRVTPLEDVIDGMRRAIYVDIAAKPHSQDVVFNIRFAYKDREKARKTVAALVWMLQEEASNSGTQAGHRAGKMTVLDVASLPIEPVSPTKTIIVAGGFLAGLLIAGLLRTIFYRGWIRRRFAVVAVALGIAGVICALSAEDLRAPLWVRHYRSTATFELPTAHGADIDAIKKELLSRTSLAQIVNDPRLRLYSREQPTTPLEDIVESMSKNVSIGSRIYGDGALLSMSFEYPDRFKAQQTTTVLLWKFRELANRRLSAPETTKPAPTIEILGQASTPINPVKPNRYLIAGMGGIGGVFLAGVISLLRRRWKPEQQIPVNS
jgi:capsular polysaccharide biosynthesis protein